MTIRKLPNTSLPQKPKWFEWQNYEFMRNAGAREWADQLEQRLKMQSALIASHEQAWPYIVFFLASGSYYPEGSKQFNDSIDKMRIDEGLIPFGEQLSEDKSYESSRKEWDAKLMRPQNGLPLEEIHLPKRVVDEIERLDKFYERFLYDTKEMPYAEQVASDYFSLYRKLIHTNSMEGLWRNIVYSCRKQNVAIVRFNLDTPDEILIEQFKNWLSDKRKNFPLPIVRAGRPSKNLSRLTKNQMRTWFDARVLALFDLEFWFSFYGRSVTNEELCGFVFPDRLVALPNPSQKISESRRLLDSAFAAIPVLKAQAFSELTDSSN